MKSMVCAVLLSLFCVACDGGPVPPPPGRCGDACNLVAKAKKDIAARKYSEAIQKCEKAEKLNPKLVEAPYCILAASFGSLVQRRDDARAAF